MAQTIPETHFDTAAELWRHLCPTRNSQDWGPGFLYRGQSNAEWRLTPTILRKNVSDLLAGLMGSEADSEGEQAFMEFQLLEYFVMYCDGASIPVPAEAQIFRDPPRRNAAASSFHKHPSSWPVSLHTGVKLIETMAMARMHGLPARLLDWTENPYVAVYFAASDALRKRNDWENDRKLAVWKLTRPPRGSKEEHFSLVYRSSGAISKNVGAQHGLFTRIPIFLNGPVGVRHLEDIVDISKAHTLAKFTVPVTESLELFRLCHKMGFNSARMYPGADGASKAVMDLFLCEKEIRARYSLAPRQD